MSVGNADIEHHYSANASSTGGAISGSTITSNVKNNVWPDVTDSERIAGGTKTRKTFWKNVHATDAMTIPSVYYPTAPANATLRLGIGFDHTNDDDPAQGNMTGWSAPAKVALISDGTDARQATCIGLDNTGTPVPISEVVTLSDASEVLSVATFTKVWAVILSATSGTRTVLVKQGTGGTTRGTIAVNKKLCFLWVSAGTAKASGIKLPNLPAGQNYGIWRELAWAAAAPTTKPNSLSITIEEN